MAGQQIAPPQQGDVLLYGAKGLYGKIIALKTWHGVGHCEVYIGNGFSVASRDGQGVGRYAARLDDIKHILRPELPFDLSAALCWFYREANGQPYGWLDLLQFIGLNINRKGTICSTFVVDWLRAGGIPIFNAEPSTKIAPFQFLTSELLREVTADEAAA